MHTTPSSTDANLSNEALAARHEITFDGKHYGYRQYHYDRFDDALRYAIGQAVKPGFARDTAFLPHWAAPFYPPLEELKLMWRHGIAYAHGCYWYGGYRYDQLSSALAYAGRPAAH